MKRRIGAVLALALALSLGWLTVASAHAELVSSDPAVGANLTAAPAKVTLVFSEEISEDESESNFTVTDESGATVGTGKLDTTDLDHKTLSGALKTGLGDGIYTVTWKTLTPDDNGHSDGSFTFGVNKNPGAQPTADHEHEEEPTAAPTARPTTAPSTAPTARPATAPTAAPAGAAPPSTLPNTAESAPNLSGYLLVGAAILLAGGLALRRRQTGRS
jgi:methionine-rich copper-binding protein CopC